MKGLIADRHSFSDPIQPFVPGILLVIKEAKQSAAQMLDEKMRKILSKVLTNKNLYCINMRKYLSNKDCIEIDTEEI